MKSICFVCETPYQLLNTINYYCNRTELLDHTVDVYIGNVFFGFDRYVDALKDEGLFDNIYTYSYAAEKKKAKLLKYIQVAMPCVFVNSLIKEPFKIKDKAYSHVFVSNLTPMGKAIIAAFPEAKVCYYDDGIGSYRSKIGERGITKKHKTFYKLVGKDISCFWPQVMYLNNPEMSNNLWRVELKQLPLLREQSKTFIDMLKRIFGGYPEVYNTSKVLYLSQPVERPTPEENKKWAQIDREVVSQLKKKGNFILRPHPREKLQEDPQVVYDTSRSLWELICLDAITDDTILIGNCSTAQFMPKFLFDKEPVLILTYRMYVKPEYWAYGDGLYNSLKEKYRDKEKLIAVESPEEMTEAIDKWQK